MNLKLALLLAGLVTSTVCGADTEGSRYSSDSNNAHQDFTRLDVTNVEERGIIDFMDPESIANRFRKAIVNELTAKQIKVDPFKFQALKRDVGAISANSIDINEIQAMIDSVLDVQRRTLLTEAQYSEVESLLINLATRMSELSSAERLGA